MKAHEIAGLVSALLGLAAAAPAAFASQPAVPAAKETPSPHVKYKAGKQVDFEELLIQGRLERPEIAVVTGDAGKGRDGLLRLRENFVDRMTTGAGEEIK